MVETFRLYDVCKYECCLRVTSLRVTRTGTGVAQEMVSGATLHSCGRLQTIPETRLCLKSITTLDYRAFKTDLNAYRDIFE
jgi:hypothetical protein